MKVIQYMCLFYIYMLLIISDTIMLTLVYVFIMYAVLGLTEGTSLCVYNEINIMAYFILMSDTSGK